MTLSYEKLQKENEELKEKINELETKIYFLSRNKKLEKEINGR